MKKKYLFKMLAIVLGAGMLFAACGKSDEPAPESDPVQETQTEPAEDNDGSADATETPVATEDYLSANGLQIVNASFESGEYAGFTHRGLSTARYVEFDVSETQTVVTIYTLTGHGKEENLETIVNFYDRYTGENILKKSDLYGMYDEETKTIEAKDGYKVERSGCEYSTHYTTYMDADGEFVSTTYTITHPANYDGLVMSLVPAERNDGIMKDGVLDDTTVKELDDAFTSEDYKIMDKHELYGFEYDVSARTEEGKWEYTGETAIEYMYPKYFAADN